MSIQLAQTIWMIAGIYAGFGLVFGILFVVFGAPRIDHAATGAGTVFRLLILPGVIGLWPLMATRLLSLRKINAPVVSEDEGS